MRKIATLLALSFCAGVAPIANQVMAEDITPTELAARQCRSVHLHFKGIPEQSTALYNEAIPTYSAPGTYFCAMNFNDGYIGFQELANGKKVLIFSIWDPIAHGDNPEDVPEEDRTKLIELGEGARGGRFGNEGTGGQSFIDYPWKLGEKMKFLVSVKKLDHNFKEIRGYFYNNKTKKWNLISAWKTHMSPKELSYAVSFVEDFRRNYDSTKSIRSAQYGPAYAYKNGEWHRSDKVGFTGDPTPSTNVMAEVLPDGRTTLQTGGTTEMNEFKIFQDRPLPKPTEKTPQPGEDVTQVILKESK